MGILDDDNLGLLGGVAQAFKSGIQGYQDEEKRQSDLADKKQRRLEAAAKIEAAKTDARRKRDEMEIKAAKEGFIVELDDGGLLKRDESGRASIKRDPNFSPSIKPLHPLQEQLISGQIKQLGEKPVQDRNKMIQEATEKGFNAAFDDDGRIVLTPTKEKMAETQAKLELLRAKAIKSKGGGKGGGKQLPANMTAEFGSTNAVFTALDDALAVTKVNPEYFNASADMAGKAKNLLQSGAAAVGADARAEEIDAELLAKAQVIGTYLEGGKLQAADEVKYKKMLPKRGDAPSVVDAKVKNLQRMIYNKMNAELNALEQGGYNTSNIKRPQAPGLINEGLVGNQPGGLIKPKPGAPAAQPAAPQQASPMGLAGAKAWLAKPENAKHPQRAAVEAKVKALEGGQ